MSRIPLFLLLALPFAGPSPALSPKPSTRTPRVLVVRIEGVRAEALADAWTPAIDGLRAGGAFTDEVRSGATMVESAWSALPGGRLPAPTDAAEAARMLGSASGDVAYVRIAPGPSATGDDVGALEAADRALEGVLDAVRARPGYAGEDWLVLATGARADGDGPAFWIALGRRRTHGDAHADPDARGRARAGRRAPGPDRPALRPFVGPGLAAARPPPAVGGPLGGRAREAPAARHVLPLREPRACARARPLGVEPRGGAERALGVPVEPDVRRRSGRLRAARLRRYLVGPDPGALRLADARLRDPDLRQLGLPLREEPTLHPARQHAGRPVPHLVRGAGRMERRPHRPPLRGREVRRVRVGERRPRRLHAGQQAPGRVRRHVAGSCGAQPPGRAGAPVDGRELPRGPGLLAVERDRARRLPLRGATRAHRGRVGARGAGRGLPRRRPRPRRHAGARPRGAGPRRAARRAAGSGGRVGPGRARRRAERGGRRGRPRDAPANGALRTPLDGRDAHPVHARPDAGRSPGRLRGHERARGLPHDRHRGRAGARQRGADHDRGRGPPRARPRDRTRGLGGVDARGHPPHEGREHQRGAHLALSERPGLVRPGRRARPVPGGRGEHRVARDGLRPRGHARERPRLDARAPDAHAAHGRARQEPRVGDVLVARQRGGQRRQLRGDVPVDQRARPDAARAVRARRAVVEHRPLRADVPGLPAPGGVRPQRGPPAAHHVRVCARDGQQRRELRRLLGRSSSATRSSRAASSGTGSTRGSSR